MEKSALLQVDEAFVKLLRLGMYTCNDRDVTLTEQQWLEVRRLSIDNEVCALMLEGVARLLLPQKPGEDLMENWVCEAIDEEQDSLALLNMTPYINDTFQVNDLPMIMLDGAATASLYKKPTQRHPWHTRLWTTASLNSVKKWVKREGLQVRESTGHELTFMMPNKFTLTVTDRPMQLSMPITNSRLQKFMDAWKECSLLHKVTFKADFRTEVGHMPVPVNVMRRLMAVVKIFDSAFSQGLLLRDVIDAHYIFTQVKLNESEVEEEGKVLKAIRLDHFAACLNYVIHCVTDINPECLPCVTTESKRLKTIGDNMLSHLWAKAGVRMLHPEMVLDGIGEDDDCSVYVTSTPREAKTQSIEMQVLAGIMDERKNLPLSSSASSRFSLRELMELGAIEALARTFCPGGHSARQC